MVLATEFSSDIKERRRDREMEAAARICGLCRRMAALGETENAN